MPVFEVETADGTFEVEAPSLSAAASAIKSGRAAKAGIGYGRAAAQGALIDTPEAVGGMGDLLRNVSLPMIATDAIAKRVGGAAPESYAVRGKALGERLIGPRQQGSEGEERLSRAVRGGLVSAPFGVGGPLAMASTVLGGAGGDVAQGEAEKRGLGPLGGAGVGAAVDIATGLAARNIPRAYRGIMALRTAAKPATQEMGEALAKLAAKEAAGETAEAAVKPAIRRVPIELGENAVKHDILDDAGEVVGSIHGRFNTYLGQKTLRVENSGIDIKSSMGRGYATSAYQDLIDYAESTGRILTSDMEVTESAARVYEGLGRRGLTVKMNPSAVLKEGSWSVPGKPNAPVFTVSSKAGIAKPGIGSVSDDLSGIYGDVPPPESVVPIERPPVGHSIPPASADDAMEFALKQWDETAVPKRVAVDQVLKKRGIVIPENLRIPEAEDAVGYNIGKTVRDLADVSKQQILESRGGVQSWDKTAEMAALARKSGLDIDSIQAGANRNGYDAAELHALNDIWEETTTRVSFSSAKYRMDPSPENMARYHVDFAQARTAMAHMVGARSETGRTQQIIKKFNQNFQFAKYVDEIINANGGDANSKATFELFESINDPAVRAAFIRKTTEATTIEKVVEAYKASFLGPMTHAVNIVSNTAFHAQNLAEEVLSTVYETARTRSSLPSRELAVRIYSMKQGVLSGMALAWEALKNEIPEEFGKAAEHSGRKFGAIGSGGRIGKALHVDVGKTIRMTFRGLGAEDAFFRTVAEQQELHALAMRSAYKSGLKGKPLWEEIARIVAKPTDEMLAASKKHGSRLVFQSELGDIGRSVQHILHKHPTAGFLIPYFKTPANLMKESIHRLPIPHPEMFRQWKMGGKARSDVLARVSIGSLITGWAMTEALDDRITGAGPENAAKRNVWLQTHRPYSFRVGDEWVSYQRIEPLATIIGTAADLASLHKELKAEDKSVLDAPGRLSMVMANNLSNKTFIRSLVDFGMAVTQPQKYGERWAESTAAAFGGFPFGGLTSGLARTIDPELREITSIKDAFYNRLPGLRGTLPIKISPVDGREVTLEGSVGPDIASPFYSAQVRNDPVAKEMEKLGMGRSAPERGDLTEDEFDTFQREAGKEAHFRAGKFIQEPSYQYLDRDTRKRKLSGIYRKARDEAKDRIMDKRLVSAR